MHSKNKLNSLRATNGREMVVRIQENDFDKAITSGILLRNEISEQPWCGVANYGPNKTDEGLLQIAMGAAVMDREKRRHERAQLNSADGNTAERHDQFYRDHKLLLVLFRALAVMPIERSAPGLVTFSWRSKATAYAVVFYALTTCMVLIVGYERIVILQTTKRFDEYVYAIVFVIFLVPHFWIPFVGWGVASQVAVYKTMWGSFQVRYIIYRIGPCLYMGEKGDSCTL